MGLPNVESDLDVGWASQVYKFLTSKDPKVVMMCARRLRDTVATRRAVKDADFDEILDFLNSRPDEGSTTRVTMSDHSLVWYAEASTVWVQSCATWKEMRPI